MLKQEIQRLLQHSFAALEIDAPNITVDYSPDASRGDYASNAALIAAKKVGKDLSAGRQDPMELAEEVAKDLRFRIKDLGVIEKIEVAKPGFINFFVSNQALIKEASEVQFPNIGKDQKVVVEYSSPNIAKPFTIGHLRSTIIGDSVANILAAVGYDVKRDNHLGDWGTQFGKQIYAIKTWGNEEEIEKSDRPVKLLVDLYVKFHDEAEKDLPAGRQGPALEDEARAWFKKLEDGDEEAKGLWQKCIDWSWKEFDSIYAQLGVSFTENNGRGFGEAYFEDKMTPVVEELKEKNLIKTGENGAQLVFFTEDQYPPLMILKKDGATLYATRDLATDRFRLEHYGKDILIINEVGAEQSLYFRQLFKLEEMLGWVKPEQRVHIKHGLYRFKEGKMSTRKGNVIWLEDVLDEAKKRAGELSKAESGLDISEQVAIGAIKWNDLKRSPEQDIAFDWDEILNMQGNSGPYMQYTYVRTKSILDKAGTSNFQFPVSNFQLVSEERELLRLLVRFEEVVAEAAVRYSPNIVATYLFELAQAFNLFYQKHQILKESEEKAFRIALTAAVGDVIKQGLHLLGIQTPEKM